MSRPRPSRRRVLRGLFGASVGLPFLEALAPARAATPSPRRLMFYFSPNGVIRDRWRPSGNETSFTLGPSLAALEPHKRKLIILGGVFLENAGGDGHTGGMGGMLTGTSLNPSHDGISGWASGMSVDQYLARKIGQATRFGALTLTATPTHLSAWTTPSFTGAAQPVPHEGNPQAVYDRLFRDGTGSSDTTAAFERLRRQKGSVLDFVLADFRALDGQVSAADRARLDAHATAIREIERRLVMQAPPQEMCPRTPRPASPGDFVERGKLQLDLALLALRCDLTRVVSFLWDGAASDQRYPFVGANVPHHGAAHARDTDNLVKINKWHGDRFAELLGKLDAVDEGDGSLLDHMSVLWWSEMSDGYTHFHDDMPFVLAGSMGGHFRTGRWVRYDDRPKQNDLLVSLLNGMGVPDTSFGRREWCRGPLPRLTS